MIVGEKLIERTFIGKDGKDAYLKACKWFSTAVISVNNSKNIVHSIEKIKTNGDYGCNKVKVTVYVITDETEMLNKHCEICKEVTGSFFMSDNKYKCYSCKIEPYRKRIMEKLKLIKGGLKIKINES